MVTQQIWIFSMQSKNCRVCGLGFLESPWGQDGQTPSWEVCPCCGTEFGYEDCTLIGVRSQRNRWLASGAKWVDKTKAPDDWSLEKQIAAIPVEYV